MTRTDRALVTGSSGLIGRQVVEAFARKGWQVDGLDATTPAPASHGRGLVRHHLTDISDPESLSETATGLVGGLDCLVHAAAATARGEVALEGSLTEIAWSEWKCLVDINLNGSLAVVRAFADALRQAAPSRVLLVGSIQGLVPTIPTGAYGVTKAGVDGLARQLAAELADDGITVNVLAPGTTTEHGRSDGDINPLGRTASAKEMASAIVELATGSFGFLTGATIPLDGGEHLRPRTSPSPPESAD